MYLLRKAKNEDKSWLGTWNLGVTGELIGQIDNYFILESVVDEQPVGMLAIEFYDQIAYLHSLRLMRGLTSVEHISKLFDHVIAYCTEQGKAELCLVVPPTSTWLLELGFMERSEVPDKIKDSVHYRQIAEDGILLAYPLTA